MVTRFDGDAPLQEAYNKADRLAALDRAELAAAGDDVVAGVALDVVLMFGMIGLAIAEYLRDIRGELHNLTDRP